LAITLSTKVMNIRIADPYDTIPLLRDAAAQLNFVSIIREFLVEAIG
jgi:hypothetical protein